MKFKTFEALLNNCKDLYDSACSRDRRLSDALGGDTQVMSDFWDKNIVETLKIIQDEYDTKGNDIEWLFWESMNSNDGTMDFQVDGITYDGTIQNVWMDLEGILDERFAKKIDKIDSKKNNNEPYQQVFNFEFDSPIKDKDFADDTEFYNYIKFLFECQGIVINEVDNEDDYNFRVIKFETQDFNAEIKKLIYENDIFSISLHSASLENSITVDW